MNEYQITKEQPKSELKTSLIPSEKYKKEDYGKPVYTRTLKNKSGKSVEFAVCYGYLIISGERAKPQNILYHNILGASAMRPDEETKADLKETCKLRLHLAVKTEKKGIFGKKTIERDEEYYCDSREDAWKWRNIILQCANNPEFDMSSLEKSESVPEFKRNLLVFVNPFGGAGKATKNWAVARKILEKCGCDFVEIRTEYYKHCEEYLAKADISELLKFDGIVTVSGDGLPHEAINGLKKRSDFDKVRHIPLGPIPGGSGNAIVKNFCDRAKESNSIESACYLIAKGQKIPIDLMKIERHNGPVIYSFLSVNWAVIADIDLESEKLRCLGGFRFDVYGAVRVLSMRRYRLKFAYTTEKLDPSQMPKFTEEIVNSNWNKIEDTYSYIVITNMPFISAEDAPCPISSLDDGHVDYSGQRGNNATRGKLLK